MVIRRASEVVAKWRQSRVWRGVSDLSTLGSVMGSGAVALGVLRLTVGFLVDLDWGWYVLGSGAVMVATGYLLNRRPSDIRAAAELAAVQRQMDTLASEVAVMRSRPPVPLRLPPQRQPTTVKAAPRRGIQVDSLRDALAEGMSLYDRMPTSDADGLGAARALAEGENPPPGQAEYQAWQAKVVGLLDGDQGEQFNAARATGMLLFSTMGAAMVGDRSGSRRLEMAAKLRLLAEIVRAAHATA